MSTKTIGAFTDRLKICMIIWLLKLRNHLFDAEQAGCLRLSWGIGTLQSAFRFPSRMASHRALLFLPWLWWHWLRDNCCGAGDMTLSRKFALPKLMTARGTSRHFAALQ